MKTKLIITFAAMAMCACGGVTNNTSNSSRSNSNTSSSANTNTNSDTKSASSEGEKPAINKDAFGFYTEIKESPDPKAFIGRSVTVTELDLKEIEPSTLHLGYSWYFFVECEGSFSDYMSVKDVVAKRATDNPVQATIKGVIKDASKDKETRDPCVLTDVKK